MFVQVFVIHLRYVQVLYYDVFLELFEQEQETNFCKRLDEIATNIIENMFIAHLKQNKYHVLKMGARSLL